MPDDKAVEPTDWSFVETARPRVVALLIAQGCTPELADDVCARALHELYEWSLRTGKRGTERLLRRRALWRRKDEREAAARRLQLGQDLAARAWLSRPDCQAIARVRLGEVQAEMSRHSELERRALYLRTVGDYTEKETAEICGRSVKSVERGLAR